MHMFAASGVYIEMSPWPPPFTMMERQGYAGQLKCNKGTMMRACLS
jgi:hypothetical protein